MRKNNVLSYILGDHLGSTSLVTDSSGVVINQTKYKAWGEVRYQSGANPSEYTYTGQYSYTDNFGLMFYNARWYDSSLSRFAQADTIVPSGSQGLDRYAYGLNNPSRYTDPSGHIPVDCYGTDYCGASNSDLLPDFKPSKPNSGLPNVPDGVPTSPSPNPTSTPSPQNPLIPTPSYGSTTTPIPTVCSTPMPNQTSCQGYPALPSVYYTYEGSFVPVIGLAVDVGGMIVDGASVVGTFFGPPGILTSAKVQFAMSSVEFIWSGIMQSTGQYEAVYDHTASLLDSNTARYTDSQEMVPIAGFTASFISATNNIEIILNGFVPHYSP